MIWGRKDEAQRFGEERMKIFGNEKMMHKDLDKKGETQRDFMARDERTIWGNNCNRKMPCFVCVPLCS